MKHSSFHPLAAQGKFYLFTIVIFTFVLSHCCYLLFFFPLAQMFWQSLSSQMWNAWSCLLAAYSLAGPAGEMRF